MTETENIQNPNNADGSKTNNKIEAAIKEHKRHGSLFTELISLRRMDIFDEELIEEGMNSRKESNSKREDFTILDKIFDQKIIPEIGLNFFFSSFWAF